MIELIAIALTTLGGAAFAIKSHPAAQNVPKHPESAGEKALRRVRKRMRVRSKICGCKGGPTYQPIGVRGGEIGVDCTVICSKCKADLDPDLIAHAASAPHCPQPATGRALKKAKKHRKAA